MSYIVYCTIVQGNVTNFVNVVSISLVSALSSYSKYKQHSLQNHSLILENDI